MNYLLNNWIDGREQAPDGKQHSSIFNPANGLEIGSGALSSPDDVDAAVTSAHAALRDWKNIDSTSRQIILNTIAVKMRESKKEFIDAEIHETGKTYATALAEIETAISYFDYYAGLVHLPLGSVLDVDPGKHVYTIREPYGVIGVITPWNVPLNQAARAVAPALAAGNTIVLKPAEATPSTSILLAQIATNAGLPDGVFNVVLGNGTVAGKAVVEHPLVRKLAFTGSVRTGQIIGAIAAERILPLTLELGGKSAIVVFPDADLEVAAAEIVRAFTANAGQVCSAGTRLIVHEDVSEALIRRLETLIQEIHAGRDIGPLITKQQFEQVVGYLQKSKDVGVVPAVGGTQPEQSELQGGYFINPTIFTDVDPKSDLAQDEIFGPVLVTMTFTETEDAINIANDTQFGLAAGVFTADMKKAFWAAKQLEAGQVYINSWSTSSVAVPFGGQKYSGYGREKGIEAISHYTQTKSVTVAL